MSIHEEFEKFKNIPKHGLHKIPEHILAISRYGYLEQALLDVLVSQISRCSYTEAQNTIKTMHSLLGELPSRIAVGADKRAETILRLNSIKHSLTSVVSTTGSCDTTGR